MVNFYFEQFSWLNQSKCKSKILQPNKKLIFLFFFFFFIIIFCTSLLKRNLGIRNVNNFFFFLIELALSLSVGKLKNKINENTITLYN